LKQLHIQSPEQRRICGHLIKTLLKGKERINAETFLQLADNSKGLRLHNLKLFKPRCKTTILHHLSCEHMEPDACRPDQLPYSQRL